MEKSNQNDSLKKSLLRPDNFEVISPYNDFILEPFQPIPLLFKYQTHRTPSRIEKGVTDLSLERSKSNGSSRS